MNYPIVSYVNRSAHGGVNTRLNGRVLSDIEFEQLLNADISMPGLRRKRLSPSDVIACMQGITSEGGGGSGGGGGGSGGGGGGVAPGGGVYLCPNIKLNDTLDDAVLGEPYSGQITATGGDAPYTYELISGSLPPGLTLSSDGNITGTPTQVGEFEFVVSATDVNSCPASRAFVIACDVPATCAPNWSSHPSPARVFVPYMGGNYFNETPPVGYYVPEQTLEMSLTGGRGEVGCGCRTGPSGDTCGCVVAPFSRYITVVLMHYSGEPCYWYINIEVFGYTSWDGILWAQWRKYTGNTPFGTYKPVPGSGCTDGDVDNLVVSPPA